MSRFFKLGSRFGIMHMIPYSPTAEEIRRWHPAPKRTAASSAPTQTSTPAAANKKRSPAAMAVERGRLKAEQIRLRQAVEQQEHLPALVGERVARYARSLAVKI